MAIIALFFCAFAFALAVLGAICDFRGLKIPNEICILVALSFLPAFYCGTEAFFPLWHHLAAGFGMFVISFIMFAVGMLGGGDSKMATALAFWTGLKGLMVFVFVMSLVGGLLGVVALILKKKKIWPSAPENSWVGQVQKGRNAVPYGIALAVGAFTTMFYTGIFQKLVMLVS